MTDEHAGLMAFAEQQQWKYRRERRAYYADPENGLIAWPPEPDQQPQEVVDGCVAGS